MAREEDPEVLKGPGDGFVGLADVVWAAQAHTGHTFERSLVGQFFWRQVGELTTPQILHTLSDERRHQPGVDRNASLEKADTAVVLLVGGPQENAIQGLDRPVGGALALPSP